MQDFSPAHKWTLSCRSKDLRYDVIEGLLHELKSRPINWPRRRTSGSYSRWIRRLNSGCSGGGGMLPQRRAASRISAATRWPTKPDGADEDKKWARRRLRGRLLAAL